MNTAQSAEHWNKLAIEVDSFADYEESRGSSGVALRNKARTYRATVVALHLREETGQWHCVCHLAKVCPDSLSPKR